MCVNAKTFEIIDSGWYQNSKRIRNMKPDKTLKKFKINEIFKNTP